MVVDKVKLFTVAILLSIAINACKNKSNNVTYEVGKVKYTTDFPKQIDLSGKRIELTSQAYGSKWIACIVDTMLILEAPRGINGYFRAYSTNKNEYLGSFCNKGRGPGEFPNSPKLVPTEQPNTLCLADSYTGETVYKNLDSLIYFGNAAPINKVSSQVHKQGFSVLEYIDGSIRILRRVHYAPNKEISSYSILRDTALLREITVFDLTNSSGNTQQDVAAMCTAYSPITKKIYCALCDFNQINVYSLSEDPEFTICVSKEKNLYTQQDFDNVSRFTRKYFYKSIVCSEKYLFALYYNLPVIEYDTNKDAFPIIQVFTLRGEPVAELHITEKLSDIEFDPMHNRLYGFTQEESFICYNLDMLN